MRVRYPLFTSFLAAALLATAAPLGAFTLVEANPKVVVRQGETFSIQVTLPEAVLCKGTHQLSPRTPYRVDVVSLGDGSVRASFFDAAGQNAGEANGSIAVLRKGAAPAAGAHAPGESSSMQKVQPGTNAAASLNFAKLGFGPNSSSKLNSEGQKRTLEILSQDRTYAILIAFMAHGSGGGEQGSVQVPAVQKAREAAAQPH